MDDGLVPKFNPADADQFFVLILIVVEDGLVHVRWLVRLHLKKVLILIVVEDGLVRYLQSS